MKNNEQLAIVRGYLIGNGVTSPQLQDDLTDHICCVIEDCMNQGQSFSDSLSNAIDHVIPNGPAEIQEDLNYLLTINNKIMLRKLIYGSTYLSALLVITGLLLRIPHLISSMDAMWFVMAGGLFFSISTVPFFFYERYQKSVSKLRSE